MRSSPRNQFLVGGKRGVRWTAGSPPNLLYECAEHVVVFARGFLQEVLTRPFRVVGLVLARSEVALDGLGNAGVVAHVDHSTSCPGEERVHGQSMRADRVGQAPGVVMGIVQEIRASSSRTGFASLQMSPRTGSTPGD
jgi:hypothetical protein